MKTPKLQWYQDPIYAHVMCARLGPLRFFVAGPAVSPRDPSHPWAWGVEGWHDGFEQYSSREGHSDTRENGFLAAEEAARVWLTETLRAL